jgi:putative ABC transport system permease protein
MRGNRRIEELLQDLSYALRTLRRSPVFALVAVLSLALGIGANIAIFSLIDALLLRSLPVRDPERLVIVGDPARVSGLSSGGLRNDLFSYPLYQEIRRHNQVLTDVFASGRTGKLTVGVESVTGRSETARGRLVSGNYFSVLGVSAFRGRTFTAGEDRGGGGAPFVVLSHDYWRRRFAREEQVLGRRITLNGHPFTILGVMPPGFFGEIVGGPTDLWVPLSMQPQINPGRMYLDRWDISWLLLMGRLKPGLSMAQARS